LTGQRDRGELRNLLPDVCRLISSRCQAKMKPCCRSTRALALSVAVVVFGCADERASSSSQSATPSTPTPIDQLLAASAGGPPGEVIAAAVHVDESDLGPGGVASESIVLVGAGDIASCESSGDEATAALLDSIPGVVFVAGDNAYDYGTWQQYADCYGPSWGRHRERTLPAPGNHDYNTPGAAGYYRYFGDAAGDPERGYYSTDLGAWHVVVLNSNVPRGPDSDQIRWLRADLAADSSACTLAIFHHPRFNSGGNHGDNRSVGTFWQALYEGGADVIVNGHEHIYERFGPQTPLAEPDPARGIRQFTVGTGGRSHYHIGRIRANSEVRESDSWGVLKLTLSNGGYAWEFVPVAGSTFRDSGSAVCH
jgi:hypothetical protein